MLLTISNQHFFQIILNYSEVFATEFWENREKMALLLDLCCSVMIFSTMSLFLYVSTLSCVRTWLRNWIEINYYFCRSKLTDPDLKEGFTEVITINFVPKFEDKEKEKLFKKFLLGWKNIFFYINDIMFRLFYFIIVILCLIKYSL